jgi:hypothetical protein
MCLGLIFISIVIICFLLYKQNAIKYQICNKIKKILYDNYLDELDNLRSSENRIIKIKKALIELKNEKQTEYIKNIINDYIKLKENENNIKSEYEKSLEFNYILYDIFNKKIISKILN